MMHDSDVEINNIEVNIDNLEISVNDVQIKEEMPPTKDDKKVTQNMQIKNSNFVSEIKGHADTTFVLANNN
jgi:hypothetical protein